MRVSSKCLKHGSFQVTVHHRLEGFSLLPQGEGGANAPDEGWWAEKDLNLRCLTAVFTFVEKKEGFFPNSGSTAVSNLLALCPCTHRCDARL